MKNSRKNVFSLLLSSESTVFLLPIFDLKICPSISSTYLFSSNKDAHKHSESQDIGIEEERHDARGRKRC